MSTQSSAFDIRKAAGILFVAGFLGVIVSLVIWFAGMPGGPGAATTRQGNSTVMAVYAQCLYDSSFYVSWLSCPLGGNLYLLMWTSVAALLVGLLLKASFSKST